MAAPRRLASSAARSWGTGVHNAAMWTFANHTEKETVYECVAIVIGIVGLIAIFQLHQWWGYVLVVFSFVISIPVGRRAIRRGQRSSG